MKIVCGICGSVIYDSEDLSNQQNANMCSLCRRLVCDKCFHEEGTICDSCYEDLTQNCSYWDCIANLRGKCTAENCRGMFLPEDEKEKEDANELSAAERGAIYDALAEELLKEFGIEILNMDDITIIDQSDFDDEQLFEEEDFDDTQDYSADFDFDDYEEDDMYDDGDF